MKNEKDISTEQTQEKKDLRLQSPNEDLFRPQDHQSAQKGGSQTTGSVVFPLTLKKNFSFPKSSRLLKGWEFRRVSSRRDRRVGSFLCVDVRRASHSKLGISVPSRFGSSPERNRFKRLVRESFRHLSPTFQESLELHIVPRQKGKQALCQDIQKELQILLQSPPTS